MSLFFLLYFNRVFSSATSWLIRTWTWHQYRIYIDVQAIQLSLLGGRIFFTGFRYHGNNETILVQNGHITWAYWLRRVRAVDLDKKKPCTDKVDGEADKSRLPCRVNVQISGLEWFVYNRSPAYDSILEGLTTSNDDGNRARTREDAEEKREDNEEDSTEADMPRMQSKHFGNSETPGRGRLSKTSDRSEARSSERSLSRTGSHRSSSLRSSRSEGGNADSAGLPLMLQLFPVHLECNKAALVMGNDSTKAVLIVKTDALSGEIDASRAETAPDPYRQIFRLNFAHPVVEMKDNQDYKEDQADKAVRERAVAQASGPLPKKSLIRHHRRKLLSHLRSMVPYWRHSVESFSPGSRRGPDTAATATSQVPGFNHWQGLSRYLDEDAEGPGGRWASVEYAAVPTIIDSPEASLVIYWDVVGKVPPRRASRRQGSNAVADINGDEAPAWAINISIKGGAIHYGPWADRLRADLQRVFFPTLCKDAVPAKPLPAGADRIPTKFKLYVELDEEATLRVPTREASKNWRWTGKETGPHQGRGQAKRGVRNLFKKSEPAPQTHQRPYGWLDVKVAANTTVSYSMDMVANANGYSNTLQVDIPTTEISSSINHELLWRSGAQRIACDLSTPLRWNGLRQWRFGVSSEDLELFLLRDHVFLLIDLVDDWTSGPPPEYLVFTPFKYYLDLQLQNFKLYLNVNDANIINNPTDMEDNTYIVIASPELHSTTCIPVDQYRPSKNAIPFDARAETASVGLHIPPWNTQASFLQSSEVGQLENLLVSGAYNYNTTTSPANTDTLILNVTGQSPTASIHGFTVRYFLKLKDNYFGDDIHFRTLEEYQETIRLKETNPEAALANRPPHKKSNDLDVILNIRADDPKVLFPANLYASHRYVQIDTNSLSADLRFTNYYMDLDLIIAPLNLSLGSSEGGMNTPISATSSTQLFIDGLDVYGHRVFGLPPTEPTYLCNWDLSVGAVTGECTPEFLSALAGAGQAFGFSFDDEENALISYSSIIMYDVIFLRVFVKSVSIWLHVEEAAFQISAGSVSVNYNDWARSHYSRRANITIPDVRLSCINSESAARNQARARHAVETDALVQTSVHLAIIGRKYDFTNERRLQQELVRRQDQRTHRTRFLYLPGLLEDLVPDPVDPPAQCFPVVPQPITWKDVVDDSSSLNSMGTSRQSRGLRRQSSFLSVASSGQDSIVRPRTSSRSSRRTRAIDYLQPGQQHVSRANGTSSNTRDVSVSTGRHSAFYSMGGDNHDRHDVVHNTVAFSSQYFAPYFPLENIQPETHEATLQSIEQEDEGGDDEESVTFNLEDIDPEILDDEFAFSSVMLELPAGLTAFFNPTSLRCVAALMDALQPTDPEDILDSVQTSSMGEIFTMQKQKKMKGLVNDFLVRVPQAQIRFVNSSDLDSPDPTREEQDQYDFSMAKLGLASRTETKWQDALKPQSKTARSSFHLRLQSVAASATERFTSTHDPQAAVWAKIEDVMASMGTKDVRYLDVDVGSITSHTSSRKIEYLASLIRRTGTLAAEFATVFEDITERETSYVRYLAHRLITDRKTAPDPGFLVRPSAVLRSARRHLRTFDSWKLAMRLRQTWSNLSRSEKHQLKADCCTRSKDVPDNAREQAVAAFQRWRSWDLDNVSESAIMNRIFGPATGRSNAPDGQPLLAVVRLRETRLVLDPGPKQNEIRILDLTARIETQHTARGTVSTSLTSPSEEMVVVNIFCGDASVELNWELCGLIDDTLKLYNRIQSKDNALTRKPGAAASTTKRQQPAVHCVVALNRGSIALETVNLHASSLGEGIALSLLRTATTTAVTHTNMILNCRSIVSRLRNRSQPLGKLTLRSPSIFIAHELRPTATTDCHTLKATASSRDLSVVVRQDPVVLAEVVDSVIRDEVGQIHRLIQGLPPSSTPPTPSKTMADRLSAFRVNVAIFADQYTISVPLLPSLVYNISGTVTRAAMAANSGKEIIFDFDVKDNYHEMQINVNKAPRTVSLLQIPPTNGRISSRTEGGEHSIVVSASVELVQLDASAVYSLLTALNRPEITNAVSDFQQQVQIINGRLADVCGGSEPSSKGATGQKPSSEPAYCVYLTLAGLEIFGNSPTKSELAPVAHISFHLDSVHLQLTNQRERRGPILQYPDAHINLRRIAFGIQRGSEDAMESCGDVCVSALISATSKPTDGGGEERFLDFKSDGFSVNLTPDAVSTAADVLGFMGDKIKDLDTSRELEYLRKIRQPKPRIEINGEEAQQEPDIIDTFLSSIIYTFEVSKIRLAWLVNGPREEEDSGKEDLVFTLERIEFSTRTKNSARLTIENLQVQMVSAWQDKRMRSPNSALLPEMIFNVAYVSTADTRRLAFQAVGKGLDLRLTSGFIIPAANLKDSISLSVDNVQKAALDWSGNNPPAASEKPEQTRKGSLLGTKRLESFLVDADFAGAVVYLTGRKDSKDMGPAFRGGRAGMAGKYGQFSQDDGSTVLRSPGLALKMEYNDNGKEDPTLYAEVKIDASSNILYPSVVPLAMDLMNSVKEVVSNKGDGETSPVQAPEATAKIKTDEGENILASDPSAVLGRVKLNLGMRICRQEFSLSCQPIARVAATASFQDVYFTANTVRSAETGNFFAVSGAFKDLQASVQHVYSRESTGSFEVDSITLSLMNSKHVSGTSGFSAILKVSPMKVSVNAKQLQDFLLFREIWVPRDLPHTNSTPVAKLAAEASQGHLMQRYQQVAGTTAFPWTATIFISALDIKVDLGQALGKSVFSIEHFWVSSKKTSDWEQNLCLGFSKIGADSTGRMSGFVALQNFQLRTLIRWPEREAALNETPLVQASIGFSQLRVKAAFDYQAFLVADITSMEFLMYNVRRSRDGSGDRLVAIFDGDALQIYGTTTSAAQGVALFQAFQRLAAERKANFETSLKEIERFMKRSSAAPQPLVHPRSLRLAAKSPDDADVLQKSPISLDTDVVVTLKALNLGVFPSTFSDHQVFKVEALNAQARFAASIENRRIHSVLGLTLGQLRIGLAGVRQVTAPKALSELSVDDVVQSATGSRGGTILKVPRVEAVMQTWQSPQSRQIEYIFKSAFEGKVEVGWNYSRISYIRGMWAKHSRSLASAVGRELPAVSAIRVTGVPDQASAPSSSPSPSQPADGKENGEGAEERQKITAEVKVPQSKYEYTALEPPVIETPQLRDMGEATPPLEWIGLNRDKLPNLTHQIVIVSLLELAGEVEDAYSRILGSS